MADIGRPVRKIRIDPEPRRRHPDRPRPPEPKQPEKEPAPSR